MLLLDNIKEVAYQADYFTTVKLLEILTNLDNDNFWNNKWIKMYPNEDYVSYLTRQDNFLIKERKDISWVLIFIEEEKFEVCNIHHHILYEYNEDLRKHFDRKTTIILKLYMHMLIFKNNLLFLNNTKMRLFY